MGEEATDAADATEFYTLLHLPEILKLQNCLLREVVVAVVAVVATARCTLVATTTELKPELKQLTDKRKMIFTLKNSSEQVVLFIVLQSGAD